MNRGLVYFHFDPHHQVRDYVLAALSSLRPHADHVLLVSNSPIGEADRVRLETCCDEILQRPNEGLDVGAYRAGLEHLGRCRPVTGLIAVLTCDAPSSWRALPVLIEALRQNEPEVNGVCARDGDHVQYLLGLYRRRALAAAVAPGGTPLRDTAVRRALGRLRVAALPVPHGVVRDLDTWAEVRAWDTDAPE